MVGGESGTTGAMLAVPDHAGFQEPPVLPRICLAPARAMYLGPGLGLAPHLNMAVTLAVALGDAFELRTWSRRTQWSAWRSCLSAQIPAGTMHHLRSSGPMAFLYLDPLTDHGDPLSPEQLDLGRHQLLAGGHRLGIGQAFAAFGLQPQPPSGSRMVKAVLEIERRPAAFGRIQEAADLACLSPSRFRARFASEVGLPFRRYRMWRRMAVVVRLLAQGGNMTQAALEAGFASSAHLSSSFKRMFGLSLSDLTTLGVSIDLSEDRVVGAGEGNRTLV